MTLWWFCHQQWGKSRTGPCQVSVIYMILRSDESQAETSWVWGASESTIKGQWEPCPSLWFWCQDNVHGDFGAHGTFLVTSQWMFLVCERKFCTNRWSTPQDSGAQTQTIGDSPGRDSRWSAGIAIAVNLAGSEIVGAITGDVIVDRWALQSRSDCSNECKLDCNSECKQWLLLSVVDVENYFPVSRLWRYTLRSGLIREVAKECKSLHLSLFHRDEEKNKSDLIKHHRHQQQTL